MAEVRFLFPSLPPGGSNSYFKSVFLGVTVRNSFFQGAPTLLTYAPPHKCPCASSWGISCMRILWHDFVGRGDSYAAVAQKNPFNLWHGGAFFILSLQKRLSFHHFPPTLLTYAPPHKCPCASSWGISCMRGSLPRPPRQVGGTLLRVQESTRPPYYLPPYRL